MKKIISLIAGTTIGCLGSLSAHAALVLGVDTVLVSTTPNGPPGLTISAIAPATEDPLGNDLELILPAIGGNLVNGVGTILHSGGLLFANGTQFVEVSNIRIDNTVNGLVADVFVQIDTGFVSGTDNFLFTILQ